MKVRSLFSVKNFFITLSWLNKAQIIQVNLKPPVHCEVRTYTLQAMCTFLLQTNVIFVTLVAAICVN